MRTLAVGLAVLVAACTSAPPSTPDDAARRESLVTLVQSAASGSSVDLRAALGSDWDRAVFLGPYADNAGAREVLGFDFDLERVSPWTRTEGGSVVVLVKGAQPVAWFTVPSTDVSLSCLDYESVAATDGVLTLVEDATGWRSLAGS